MNEEQTLASRARAEAVNAAAGIGYVAVAAGLIVFTVAAVGGTTAVRALKRHLRKSPAGQ